MQVRHTALRAALAGLWLLVTYGVASAEESARKPADRIVTEQYPSGAVRERLTYRNNVLVEGAWYRPDGKVLDTTDFGKTPTGWSYLLRDDGSISVMWQLDATRICNGDPLVHGLAVFMSPDQKESIVLHYDNGVPLDRKKFEQAMKLIKVEQP